MVAEPRSIPQMWFNTLCLFFQCLLKHNSNMSAWYLFLELIIFLYLLEYEPGVNYRHECQKKYMAGGTYTLFVHYAICTLNCLGWGKVFSQIFI